MNYLNLIKASLLTVGVLLISLLTCGCRDNNEFHSDKVISKAFELRHVNGDSVANGLTDFKGPTEVFNTKERLNYLKNFAEYGKKFFNDSLLNKQVVRNSEVDSALQTLKPQPNPLVRTQINLDHWKYLGYKPGQRKKELQHIGQWHRMKGASIKNDALLIENNSISKSFTPKNWRMKFSWKIKPLNQSQNITFNFSDGAVVGFNEDGKLYYKTDGEKITARNYNLDQYYNFKVEIDLESGKYNFYIDDQLVADFVPLAQQTKTIDKMSLETNGKMLVDNLWAVGYRIGKQGSRTHPYYINTFIDQDFSARPNPGGFEQAGYDDSQWSTVPYRRYAHGGERNRGETLYLRKKITVGDFEQARLHIETVRPSGILYINGQEVANLGRVPKTIDIARWLRPSQQNMIAVKVDSFSVKKVQYHMNTDKWSSIFAGLMKLKLTNDSYISNVYTFTSKIDSAAYVRLNIKATSKQKNGFSGTIETDFYPWYPNGSSQSAGRSSKKIQVEQDQEKIIKQNIKVTDPQLWTTNSPNLYKIRVKLKDEDGKVVDDYVTTTGLRTISQEDGIFRINGKPEVLYGPLVFNQPYPLERVSQWMFSPPKSKWVETILETKKMNANAIRMSVHDKRIAGINDKRLARIGDQMGIMFMWQTPAWIRVGSTKQLDLKHLPTYINEIRNNPSIVMWQPGNHPTYTMEWFDKVYKTIDSADSSRLISPAADLSHMRRNSKHPKRMPNETDSKYPAWTASMVARGNMEQTTSYGREWDVIRKFPDNLMEDIPGKLRKSYLQSPTHAWFDFESEETIGIPNWSLNKGKPYHKIYSYEKHYSKGNIGRALNFSEWQQSQAWQALSGYEAYRKKRWLDYDGMNWCNLRGGPNSATYMKPLIEYEGAAKLGYYAIKMVYQRTLAGSKNVDLVYGPDDEIPIAVMHLGKARNVNVRIVAKTMDGQPVAHKEFYNVKLKSGRNVTDLESWKPDLDPGQYYAFEYTITK